MDSHRTSSVSTSCFAWPLSSPGSSSRPTSGSWNPYPPPRGRLPSFSYSQSSYLTSDEDELPLTSDFETDVEADVEEDKEVVYTGIYKTTGLYKGIYRPGAGGDQEVELSLVDNDERTTFFTTSSERGAWRRETPTLKQTPYQSYRPSPSAASSTYPSSSPSYHAPSTSPSHRESSPLPSSSPPTSPGSTQDHDVTLTMARATPSPNALPSNAFITMMPSPPSEGRPASPAPPRISNLSASRPSDLSDILPTFTSPSPSRSSRLTIGHLIQSSKEPSQPSRVFFHDAPAVSSPAPVKTTAEVITAVPVEQSSPEPMEATEIDESGPPVPSLDAQEPVELAPMEMLPTPASEVEIPVQSDVHEDISVEVQPLVVEAPPTPPFTPKALELVTALDGPTVAPAIESPPHDDCASVDMDLQSDDEDVMAVDAGPTVLMEAAPEPAKAIAAPAPIPAVPLSALQSIHNIMSTQTTTIAGAIHMVEMDVDVDSDLSSPSSSPLSSRASSPEPMPPTRKFLKGRGKEQKGQLVKVTPRSPKKLQKNAEATSSASGPRLKGLMPKRKTEVESSDGPPRKKKCVVEPEASSATKKKPGRKPKYKTAEAKPLSKAAVKASAPSPRRKSKGDKRSNDKNLSAEFDEDLRGTLIETMATSRSSSLPASTLYKMVKQTRPGWMKGSSASSPSTSEADDDAKKHQWTSKEWTRVIERALYAGQDECGLFGKVDSSFNDEAERGLEAQWFYVPEKDCDQERASLIRSLMPRPAKRSVTKQYKQYYYKPLDKISRWDPEDDL